MTRSSWILAVLLAGCSPQEKSSVPGKDVAPGEEPLETVSLGDEDVVPLEPEKGVATAAGRPCTWARAWSDPGAAKPLHAGVGGVPNPSKTVDAPVRLPVKEPPPAGEMVVEIVVDSDGNVSEASVVRSTDPPWPEAEERLLQAVRKWRYETLRFDGTPVSVCTTVVVKP